MPDFSGLLESVKKSAVEAVDASKPVYVQFGTVVSVSPLEINVEQKMTIPSAMLILTKAVTNYYVDIKVSHLTEETSGGSGESAYSAHSHEYSGKKTIMVCNGLKAGETVILVRVQGGQKWVVFDRTSDHMVDGEWI